MKNEFCPICNKKLDHFSPRQAFCAICDYIEIYDKFENIQISIFELQNALYEVQVNYNSLSSSLKDAVDEIIAEYKGSITPKEAKDWALKQIKLLSF